MKPKKPFYGGMAFAGNISQLERGLGGMKNDVIGS
jgi:hypothetical protein